VFGKRLTLWNPSKQRHFRQKSEVVRSFLSSTKKKRHTTRKGNYWQMCIKVIIALYKSHKKRLWEKTTQKKEDTPLAHPLYKMVLMGIIP
jgi:metal-responsive CopG/Arc/MetJ family transcriptional regulator